MVSIGVEHLGREDDRRQTAGSYRSSQADRQTRYGLEQRRVTDQPAERSGSRPSSAEAAALFDAFAQRVHGYVAFRVRDTADADDLTAEVFRRVVAGPVPANSGAWPAWLFRVAHNVVIDHYRRRRFPNIGGLLLGDRPDDAPSLPDRMVRDEQVRTVDAALGSLPSKQRAAIYLRYYEDLDYSQIAEVLGIPAVTARSLVHRGLKRLAGDLSRQEVR